MACAVVMVKRHIMDAQQEDQHIKPNLVKILFPICSRCNLPNKNMLSTVRLELTPVLKMQQTKNSTPRGELLVWNGTDIFHMT